MTDLKKYFGFNDLLLLGALVLALGLVWNTVTAMQRNYQLQQQYDQLQDEVEVDQLENENLTYNIAYLKTNDYKELAARDLFNKALPGENLVYLPSNNDAPIAPVGESTQAATKAQPKGWRANLQAWVKFLDGKQTTDNLS